MVYDGLRDNPQTDVFAAAYYRKWLEPHERKALVEACREVDPGRLGRIPVAAIGKILATVGSEVTS